MALVITTTSSTDYMTDRANAIYPAFVDNLEYDSWIEPQATIAASRRNYFDLKATGGVVAKWEIISGALPKGLSLNKLTGRISGTPKKIGNYSFKVKATSTAGIATKDLVFEARPERSRWLKKALIGVNTPWSKMNYPGLFRTERISGVINTFQNEFKTHVESNLKYNPEADAEYDQSLGYSFREVVAVYQDASRMWPSSLITRYNDKAQIDFIGQYAAAYHARNMKLSVYIAPDYNANKVPGQTGSAAFDWTDGDIPFGNWSGPSLAHFTELVQKGVDMVALDIGGASDLFVTGFANAGWWNWERTVPAARYWNPDFFFCVNPGVRYKGAWMGGAQARFPWADAYMFETTKSNSTSASLFEVGTPPMPRKKVAIYTWQQPTESFGFGSTADGAPLKDIAGAKEKMSQNWENGCAWVPAYPVPSTGEYPYPYFKSYFEEMAAHAASTGGYSSFVEAEYENGYVTITAEPDERIYYTTDGTRPSFNSNVYVGPIKIDKPTFFRMRAKHPDKLMGHVEEYFFGQELESISTARKAFSTAPNVVHAVDTATLFRGCQYAPYSKDIIVEAVGRQVSGTATIDHEFIIRRRADEFFTYLGTLSKNAPVVDGFQWLELGSGGIRLSAGAGYLFAFKEGTVDTYASNIMTVPPLVRDFRIDQGILMSKLGDVLPNDIIMIDQPAFASNYGTGQFINIRYRTVDSSDTKDLMCGRKADAFDNSGNLATINASIYFATNANNNLNHTFCSVGNIYPWTWRGEFEEPRLISRVEIDFAPNGFSSEFQIYGTMNGTPSTGTLIAQRKENQSFSATFVFTRKLMKYLHVRSLKPDGAGQLGGGMTLQSVRAYY